MNRKTSFAVFIFSFLGMTGFGFAVTPMDYYDSLVAGGDGAGFRDGAFALARFSHPAGLALNETGTELYVSDPGNHRIRVIHLDQNNDVETLAGTGAAGIADGPVSTATFNHPTKLAALPGEQLAVFEAANGLIRLINFSTQTVSTLAHGVDLQDMVYRPQDDSLYFSEPGPGKIKRLDLKSLEVSDVLSNNSQVPAPGALCLDQGRLCVADLHLPAIYELDPAAPKPVAVSVTLTAVGNAKDVLALASSDGHLYALQAGGNLFRVGLPNSKAVKFPAPWGFLFGNKDYALPFLNPDPDTPAGFLASSVEPKKFYLLNEYSVVSVRDYDFEAGWDAFQPGAALTDFNYPAKKPAGTFRILVTGSSRNSTSVHTPSDPLDFGDVKMNTYSKQMEFLLNTRAALQNSSIHFEVLNFTRWGSTISTYAYYEIPRLVQKYDIDLVVGIADFTGYKDYYLGPLTAEGIPAEQLDMDQAYMAKPLSARASGPAADLIQRCRQLKIPVSEKQDCPGDGGFNLICADDARLQGDLREMAGRRLGLLQKKLNAIKTSDGHAPQFVIFYLPNPGFPDDCCSSFWKSVSDQYGLKFLDLTEPYYALKDSYFPVTDGTHFTAYGNKMIAEILAHELVEDKLIVY